MFLFFRESIATNDWPILKQTHYWPVQTDASRTRSSKTGVCANKTRGAFEKKYRLKIRITPHRAHPGHPHLRAPRPSTLLRKRARRQTLGGHWGVLFYLNKRPYFCRKKALRIWFNIMRFMELSWPQVRAGQFSCSILFRSNIIIYWLASSPIHPSCAIYYCTCRK